MKFIKSLITPKKALIFTIIIFGFLFITQGEPYYRSDEWCYYTISKSLIDKNSFVNSEKPEYFDYMEHVKETYNNNYISVCSPGVSIIQLPGLIVANFFKGDKTIYNDYFMAYNGHTLYEGVAALITAMFFALVSLVLIFKTLKLLGFGDKTAIISTGASFISSFAIWYVFLGPSFTHIYEIFAISAIVYPLVKLKKEPRSRRLLLSMGLAVGLSFLIRPTLIPLGVVIGLYFLVTRRWRSLLYFIAGGIPTLLLWFAYNLISYGGIIASGYSVVRTENFNLTNFNGFNMLFSQYRGWLIYSPIFIFAIAGLVLLYKKNKLLSIAALVSIFSTIIVYGFWPSWWGGGSYGQRFMIFAVPFGAIGLSVIARSAARWQSRKLRMLLYILMILTFAFSLGLVGLYRITVTSKLSESFEGKIDGMYSADRYTPFEMYQSNIDLIKNASSVKDYFASVYKNVNGGSGILAILTGTSNGVLRVDDRELAVDKLNVLTPPILRRELPSEVFGYYKSDINNKLYTFTITDIESGDILEINCASNCSSSTKNLILIESNYGITKLPTAEYVSIVTNKGHFYFKYISNLQFRGFPENIPVGETEFTI
ncbi:MAG: hypothetical protein ABIM99_02500 [Candidatus Dojkabacteria bacterium]